MSVYTDAASSQEAWVIAALADVRVYSSLNALQVSIRMGRKSSSFVKDIEGGRYANVAFANVLALCNVYEVKLQFILTMYDQRNKVTQALTKRWLKSLDVEAVGFDDSGRKELIRGIEHSGSFCLRVAVGKALMEEYSHIRPLETLALSAVVENYDWPFSI